MSLIPELERELYDVAARGAAPARARRSRRRLFTLLPVALAVCATGALAAGGVIPLGSTAQEPGFGGERANEGNGVVVPGTPRVLGLQVPDPDGGPPWGLRIASTTRGLGCLVPGRLVDGRVGVLGRDGSYGNDGRFHPFGSTALGGPGDCGQLGANGRLFINVGSTFRTSSGGSTPECALGAPPNRLCDGVQRRHLYYGTLGPQAQSVTYDTGDGSRTVPTTGPEGAYLIVTRPGKLVAYSGTGAALYPYNGPITAIRFRDGRTCAITRSGPAGPCPLPGYEPPAVPAVTRSQLSSHVTARRTRARRGWDITISFRARIAVTDASAAYNIAISAPGHSSRGIRLTRRNIARGELVTWRFPARRGHGVYHGSVSYHRISTPGQTPMGAGGIVVGRFAIRLP